LTPGFRFSAVEHVHFSLLIKMLNDGSSSVRSLAPELASVLV
jgi:hypothetical protein